ncbi:MAG: hypothetical protein COA82_07905 [Alkaliphilus sp.]|nr:TIM barrel protein [Alkaliphilus sp. AH-315-G20]PHS33905.1 MAG: hypothetical protein COA82_07905 [Alkaliphilus sp.]
MGQNERRKYETLEDILNGGSFVNYYIGMHNEFDKSKFERDIIGKISGIELCNFKNISEVRAVKKLADQKNLKLGIHFPLLRSSYKYRDPMVTSVEKYEYEEAFQALEMELKFAKQIEAEYLLIHFPKPMVLDPRLNWSMLKFGTHDAVYENELTSIEFITTCESAMDRLEKMSEIAGIPIVLEIEIINKWLYEKEWFVNLLDKYKNISICLDSARLHIQGVIDDNFDISQFVSRLSSYTKNLHIANIQVRNGVEKRHYPALPELKEQDGWCNIVQFTSSIEDRSKLQNVLYEHKSDSITLDELRECYSWIESQLETI